ncbi:hypothetical protein GFC01_10115 [Desulfofundulus thermobenzoicus]|uniref:Uncharacterized protein n=1 Tax=Desulfofundulus thermobenzoicus TaxID=29376 RepID=A0A6N7IRR5_9FIRM|nr:hypothetical protein [Desulfofundulus thermobenzoicus]MQL52611.1 hypothetical protein [Desulfofundulus thermobenzoicus]
MIELKGAMTGRQKRASLFHSLCRRTPGVGVVCPLGEALFLSTRCGRQGSYRSLPGVAGVCACSVTGLPVQWRGRAPPVAGGKYR